MRIDTRSISRNEGASIVINEVIRPEDMPIHFEGYVLNGPLTLQGQLQNTGNRLFRLTGQMHAVFTGHCARCLKKVKSEIDYPVQDMFAPAAYLAVRTDDEVIEDEQTIYTYEGYIIDIAQAVRDDLLLALPTRMVCSTECRGLCPVCGQNLNEKQCECAEQGSDRQSPFNRLNELL